MKIGRTWFRRLLAASLMLAGLPLVVSAADMLVLMSGSGKVERYDSETGAHVGTVVSGLPPSNAMLFDAEGRLLISTGMPGGVGHVLRFDPRNVGKMETWLDVPEGYGGRLFRATGMTWHEGDLLVASQGDGKVKRYDGRTGEWKADVALKDGVISSLPILDKLATYTRMERFKRLALDIATASVSPRSSGGTRLEKIVVQSNGLLRIEGTLNLLPGDGIEGEFMVGVTPETLRWLPGAQNRVFIEMNPQGPPGLNWARVKVVGTRTAPQEDLSSRLLGAAGMSLLLDTPGAIVDKASETLLKPMLGEDAAKLPGAIINGTTKTLEEGVKTGSDLINKVIPLFPGSR